VIRELKAMRELRGMKGMRYEGNEGT